MSSPPIITQERNASPMVRVMGNSLRLQSSRPSVADLIGSMNGVFSIASVTDGQSLTISAEHNRLHLVSGVSGDHEIVLHIDFAKSKMPGYRPKIDNFWRHPRLTWQVGKLLSEPPPSWTDSAKRFWDASKNLPFMPNGIEITCTDEHRSLTVGTADPEVKLAGTSSVLADMMIGSSVLLENIFTGRMSAQASLKHLAALSDAGITLMMTEPVGQSYDG